MVTAVHIRFSSGEIKNTPMDTDTVTLCEQEDSQINSLSEGTMMVYFVHGVLFKSTLKSGIKTLRDLSIEGMHTTSLQYLNGAFT